MFGGQTRNQRPAAGTVLGEFRFVNQIDSQMQLVPSIEEPENDWLFDIVLGNPPYVKGIQIKSQKPFLKPLYDCFDSDADLYVYFFERGLKLLRQNGVFAYISSNKYFKSGYGEKLRRLLSTQTTIHHLIDFGDAPVFEATTYPSIIVLQKGFTENSQVKIVVWEKGDQIEDFRAVLKNRCFQLEQNKLTTRNWQLETESVLRLLDSLLGTKQRISEFVNGKLYRGIITGLNEAFIVDNSLKEYLIAEHVSSEKILKPFVRGRDIKRWRINFADQYLIRIESSENEKHPWTGKPPKEAERIFADTYPAIYAHLEKFREGLIKRDDQGKYFWELRSCVYWNEFNNPLIVWGNLTVKPQFAYTSPGQNICAPANMIVSNSHSLLGILNSTVTHYLLSKTAAQRQGGFFEYKPMYVSQLPIPKLTASQQVILDQVVEFILALAQFGKNEQILISQFESLLNGLVYALYFPKELDTINLLIFDLVTRSNLPVLKSIPINERLSVLHETHNKLFLGDHPIRSALFNLRGLDFVRIIEEESSINIEASLDEAPED